MNQQSNAIYMVAIDHGKSNWKHSNFAQYSRKSWERWCEKNGVDFFCVTEHDDRYGYPIWNKLNVIDVCKEYDKIGIVDCDTMININAPNIFDTLEDGVSGVLDDSNYNWIYHSVKNYGVYFSDELDYEKYINAGVVFLDNDSLKVYKQLQDFYFTHQEELDNWNKGGGREQTLFNYHLQLWDYKINIIPPCWNLLGLHRREMLHHNWQEEPVTNPQNPFEWVNLEGKEPHYVKYGYIYHFTGFPIEHREQIMKYTWELDSGVL